jgi:hypothetical protein
MRGNFIRGDFGQRGIGGTTQTTVSFKRSLKGSVVGVLILALFFAVTGCGGPDAPTTDPEDLRAAADSAQQAVWGELQVLRTDSIRPSAFFDSSYKYMTLAVMLEREKRLALDSFARKTVLAVDRLQSKQQRDQGLLAIADMERRYSIWDQSLDSIQQQYRFSASAYLDSAGVDTSQANEVLASLAAKERFIPQWRSQLDSLTRETLQLQRTIIHFIDTASRRIKIEGALQFSEPSDMTTYQAFTAQLEQLAYAQAAVMERSLGGSILQPEHVDTSDRKSPPDSASAPQVVRTWPKAVRVR